MKKSVANTLLFILFIILHIFSVVLDTIAAQSHSVSGRVISAENGDALPGVNILVKGTSIGTTTDFDGQFSLSIPSESDTLVFSLIGYEPQAESVSGRSSINLMLVPLAVVNKESVSVGYSSVQRRNITVPVSSVSSRDIREVPISDAGQALQGRAAGVVALSSGNRPGQGMTIRVRGRRSLTASNEPLFVVDGIPLEGGINDINPRDIQSMEVLKDASATAIYGSRGANGVILVTTNRGGNHPTTVSYSGHTGIRIAHGTPDLMNGEQFARMKEISGRDFTLGELDAIQRGVSTDWVDLLLDEGIQHNHQISIQGGNESTQFVVAGNFFYDQGVINIQDFTRNTFRLNLDHSLSDRLRFGTSTQLSSQVQNWGSNPYGGALATNPLAEAYDADGNLILRPGADPLIINPLADLVDGAYIDERERIRIFSVIYADLDIFENLNYRMNFGPDFQGWRRGLFQGSLTGARQESSPFARKQHERKVTYTFENILTYNQNFDNHALTVTGLFSIQDSRTEGSEISASELPYEHQKFHNIGTGATVEGLGSNFQEWGLMSYMARVNYRFMDRYLLTLTGRYDGLSRLSEYRRWGLFPSAALGWRISDEPFMADSRLLSDLRIRVSYGLAGNSFGRSPGFMFVSGADSDNTWESSASFNIGLDFGFWDDRVAGSVELYQTDTSDLLLERIIPTAAGFNSVIENIGNTRNRGFEFTLNSSNIHTSILSWTTSLNISGNREEIVELFGTGEDDIGNQWFIGQPLTVWYDYDMIGIWQLNEADQAAQYGRSPGEIRLRDVTGSGSVTEADRIVLGTDMPKWNLGLGNRFRFWDFDLSVFLFGSFGHTIYNQFLVNNSTLQGRYNNLNVNYWTPDNPSTDTPRPDGTLVSPINSSSRGYQSGDFLKVRNVQFGYNLPSPLLNMLGFRSARVYVNADTPFVFSYLENGLDPEIYSMEEGGVIGADIGPGSRLFTVGVNINL